MKILSIMFFCVTLCVLGGCSSKYGVTFDSNPQGASLKCGNENFGYTPGTIYLSEEKYKEIPSHMNACSANWASGAMKNYGWFSSTEFPNGVKQTVERPRGEGYTQDAEFALKVQQMRSQQAQSQAAANAKAWDDLNRSLKETAENIRRNTPKSTFTNCYDTFGGINCQSTTY